MKYFFRRLVETLIICILASVPVYALIYFGKIPGTQKGYVLAFGGDLLIYLLLNFLVLYVHKYAVRTKREFLNTNLVIGAVQAVLIAAAMVFMSADLYTMLFGYTKVFRILLADPTAGEALPMVYRAISSVIVLLLYFAEVIVLWRLPKKRKDF